jgi:hypothetical protein
VMLCEGVLPSAATWEEEGTQVSGDNGPPRTQRTC